jgi:uncharacterized Zn finger protein
MSRAPQHNPGYKPKPVAPRKVRGGIKLTSQTGAYPECWAALRWVRLVEQAAPGRRWWRGWTTRGTGRRGRWRWSRDGCAASVQGTVISAYKTSIAMPTLTHAEE